MTGQTYYHNVLIIKPSSLGDVVHALPVLGALRTAWPNAQISWLIRRELAPLLSCAQGLDAMLLFERDVLGKWYTPAGWTALRKLISQLREGQYDLVLDLQGLLRTAILGHVTGCSVRVGAAAAREGAPLFYTHRVKPPDNSLHMVDLYRAMLHAVGVDRFNPQMRLTPPAEAKESVSALLEDVGFEPGRFAVLMPGAAHASKRWPIERFAAIAERVVKQYGFSIAAVGTPGESKIVAALQQSSGVNIENLCGRTTIAQLVALLDKAALVVANDTGPGHIAIAQQRPTVLIFGPTNPAWVGPYKQPEAIVAIEPDKRGLSIRNQNPRYRIEQISVPMVMNAIERCLNKYDGEPH